MPALDEPCPNCGHGRYYTEGDRDAVSKRCTNCDTIVGVP